MKRSNILLLLFFVLASSCANKEKEFRLLWSFEYEQYPEGLSFVALSPKVVNDGVLIAPDYQVTFIDKKKGTKRWSFAFPSGKWFVYRELLTDNDNLYVKEDLARDLYSISLNDGKINWNKALPVGYNEFFQSGNDGIDSRYIYLAGRYDKIYRYNKEGGLDKIYDLSNLDIVDIARSTRVYGNQLIFSQYYLGQGCRSRTCGRIISIDKETEEELWEYNTSNGGYPGVPIILEDGVIYAVTTEGIGEAVALNARNGEVIWRVENIMGFRYTVSDSMLLVNDGGDVRAFDKRTGRELWSTNGAMGISHAESNISWYGNYVYHAHSGVLYIIDARTGEVVHSLNSPDGSAFYLSAAADGMVFVQSNYFLYAYRAW